MNPITPDSPHFVFYQHLLNGNRVFRDDAANGVREYINLKKLNGDAAGIGKFDVETLKINPHKGYPELACPMCGNLRSPIRVNTDGSVTYRTCPPDNKYHGSPYTFAIGIDGDILERGK
jgi:hypothetical protein